MPEPSAALRRRLGLALLALIAAALRAHDLAGQSLWSDEDITLDRARLPLSEMLAALPVEHGPLYFAFMRVWTRIAGESDLALRWPSLLAGVVAVPLLFWLGRRLVGARAGWIAALLAAVNPFLVAYGQEARMYALLLALAAGAFVAAADGARSRGGAGPHGRTEGLRGVLRWVACGVLMALAVLTHYYGALAVAALGTWAIRDLVAAWRDGRKKADPRGAGPDRSSATAPQTSAQAALDWRSVLGGWSIAFAAAGLLFLPWLPRALRVLEHPGWREATDLGRAPWQLAAAWSAQTGVTAMQPPTSPETAATVLYGVLGLLGLTTLLRRRAWRALLLAATPALLATLLLVRNPDSHPRYYFAVLPAWLLLVAAAAGVDRGDGGGGGGGGGGGDGILRVRTGGDDGRRERVSTLGAWAAALLLVLAALPTLGRHYTDPSARKQDYRTLLATVETQSPPAESVLLLDGPSMGLAKRYLDPDSELKLENLRSNTNRERLTEGRAAFDTRLAELAERRPHVWLASDGEGEGLTEEWLAGELYFAGREGVQSIALSRFYEPWSGQPFVVPDGRYLQLAGLDLDDETEAPEIGVVAPGGYRMPTPIHTGGMLPIRLEWRPGPGWADTPPAARAHRISLRLADESGTVVWAHDRDPTAGTRPTTSWQADEAVIDRHALPIPIDLEPGMYELSIVLYDAETLDAYRTWALSSVGITPPELDR